MKLKLSLNKVQFTALIDFFSEEEKTDYYRQGYGKSFDFAKVTTWSSDEVKALAEKIKGCYPADLNSEGLNAAMPETAILYYGYKKHNETCATYCTSAGNCYGVYESGGEYFAFYNGRRSRATDLALILADCQIDKSQLTKVKYETTEPSWQWWETLQNKVIVTIN